MYDSDVLVENRQTGWNNDRLDTETLQGESVRRRDNSSGRENQRSGEINEIPDEIRYTTFRSAEDFNRWIEAVKSRKGQHHNGGVMVGLMLRSESQVMEMLEWLYQNFKSNKMPSQEQVMDKAQEIMLKQVQIEKNRKWTTFTSTIFTERVRSD